MSSNSKMSVLVVGDVMIDSYVYVDSDRMAPEAKIPVWDVMSKENRLGGASNVAMNLKALGEDDITVTLAGIVKDEDRDFAKRMGIDTRLCFGFQTMVKTRYVDNNDMSYLFRCDNFKKFYDLNVKAFTKNILQNLHQHAVSYDAIVFSDYDKGTVTGEVVSFLKNFTRLTVVDSKRPNLTVFSGMNVLKINEQEYSKQMCRSEYDHVERLFDFVVVTKGRNGATLRQSVKSVNVSDGQYNDKKVVEASDNRYIVNSEEFPTIAVEARDVTGCGDTHTAAMTFSLLKNQDIRMAVKFANMCASKVVQKFGTSVVNH